MPPYSVTLKAIAEDRGKSLDEIIPESIERTGAIIRAAHELDVPPHVIQRWLKSHFYTVRRIRRTVVTKQEAVLP